MVPLVQPPRFAWFDVHRTPRAPLAWNHMLRRSHRRIRTSLGCRSHSSSLAGAATAANRDRARRASSPASEDGEIDAGPMARMKPPYVSEPARRNDLPQFERVVDPDRKLPVAERLGGAEAARRGSVPSAPRLSHITRQSRRRPNGHKEVAGPSEPRRSANPYSAGATPSLAWRSGFSMHAVSSAPRRLGVRDG